MNDMNDRLYFDYNATTPCDQKVLDTMLPYFNIDFGNPSSIHHSYGWLAAEAVNEATHKIANVLKISADDIIFTSGATESINMILKSFCRKYNREKNHIITSKTEHKAVLDTCKYLEKYEGVSVTYLDVDEAGIVLLDQLQEAFRPETGLVAIMYANNETGVVQPIKDIAEITASKGVFLFSDATQALGKVPLTDVFETVDFACFSAHKVYGPKGIGMIYCKNTKSNALKSLIQGGGQQKAWRGGTINTPGIVGMAKAIEMSYDNLEKEQNRLKNLSGLLEKGLSTIEMSYANNKSPRSLPNTLNISFKYVDGANLLRSLSKHMAVSNSSACNSASVEPSHVLLAMGIERSLAFSSLRFSLGRYTQEKDVLKVIEIVQKEVGILRENNILWERSKH